MSREYDDPAFWISVAALISSIALPLFLDNRQAPRVKVYVNRLVVLSEKEQHSYYEVSAINRGRSPVFINQVGLLYWHKGVSADVYLGLPVQAITRGPGLPYRIEPYSNVSFGVLQSDVKRFIDGPEKARLQGSVILSTGYRLKSRKSLPVDGRPRLRQSGRWYRRVKRLLIVKERIRV